MRHERLLSREIMRNEILTVDEKKEEKFLRKRTSDFDFTNFTKKEIAALLARMRRLMRAANGIGLSANQIGLDLNLFVAEVPDARGSLKFYAVFNPSIEKTDGETLMFEEGCLSIPGKWGDVPRAEKVTLRGFDKNAKPVKIKAWGLLARIFQHETDHLNGKLFVDRAKKVYDAEKEISGKQHET
jgi:peptide deformylase